MSLFEARAKRCVAFYDAAKPDGLLEKMNPEMRARLERFVVDYREFEKPEEALRNYYLQLAPLLTVFGRTHELLLALIDLLDAWTRTEGGAEVLKAETGEWLVDEDEREELERVQKFHAAFVRRFGATGLPPGLRKEALQKQAAEHLEARARRPVMPPRQSLTTFQATQRKLAAEANEVFDAFHDFLDGYFGKKGDEAFRKKADYSYDRHAGRGKPASEKPAPETKTPPTPGPVAQGTGAAPATGAPATGGEAVTPQSLGTTPPESKEA